MLLTEIAQQACVSPATVSRALNQPHRVAPESLARVRAVLEQCNYTPRPAPARRSGAVSRKRRVRRIGVWFVGAKANNANLNWFQEQLQQAQLADSRYGVDLRLLFSPTVHDVPAALRAEDLDGVIMQGLEPTPAALNKLREFPYVWFMTRRSASFPGDYVEPNNAENGQIAADYLHSRGHRSVAVITADPEYSAIEQRIRSFVQRAESLGLTAQEILGQANRGVAYLHILSLHEGTDVLVHRLLECPQAPTGLYLPSDHFCGSFFRALREAGRVAGRDFDAILGNYNPIIYHNLDHSPAVIDINLPTLVRRVIEHLLWRIEHPHALGRVGVTISPILRPADGGKAS